jgi:protein SCO1/2
MRQKAFVIAILLLFVGSGLVFYRGAEQRRHAIPSNTVLGGTVWPEPRPLSEFEMRDHHAGTFGPEQLRGKWSLLFFGYTSCPDICPTTMLILRAVAARLEESGSTRPAVILVSVDPGRDDFATLGDYVTHFGDDFLGVRGDEVQLKRLAVQCGAMYERETPDLDGRYEVAHSTSIFLVDPQARLYAVFSPPHDASAIAEGVVMMMADYGRG